MCNIYIYFPQEEINQEYVANLKASKICMGFEDPNYRTSAAGLKDPRHHPAYAGRVKLEKAPKRTSGVSFGDDATDYESVMKGTYGWPVKIASFLQNHFFFRSNALQCTATARILIPPACSAVS